MSRAPDGSLVVLARRGSIGNDNLLLLDEEGQNVSVILDTEFDENEARVSPDGEWLAYTSDESGQPDYTTRLPR